jgi:hypothetical protein
MRSVVNAGGRVRAMVPVVLVGAVMTLGSSGCNNGLQGGASGAAFGALAGMGIGSLFGKMGVGAAAGAIGGALVGGIIGDQNQRNSSPPRAGY